MPEWQLNTPVAFIVFNRPETTEKVFSAIAQVKPPCLFIIADGPRDAHPSDKEKCATVRNIVERIDWQCQVYHNYADANMGTRRRVSSGLNWVFEQVEEAIILEDDCLPDPTFFRFCEELLKRYRDDERIASISGTNFLFGRLSLPESYYFSIYSNIWGWATWKKAWKYYDEAMISWPTVRDQDILKYILPDEDALHYWHNKFQQTYERKVDTWDYCWILSYWLQHCLSISPSVNMVSNIGFNNAGTHTFGRQSKRANMQLNQAKFPLIHPEFMLPNRKADSFMQHTYYHDHQLAQIKTKIKKLIVHHLESMK